jgi:hypothetical protein
VGATQQLSPGAVISRIWEIYRAHSSVLIGTAALVFAIQLALVAALGGVAGLAVAFLFWVLAVLYQGMVVKLVQDVESGRGGPSVAGLLRSVEPVLVQLLVVSILFAIGVAIGFVLVIIPGLILLVIWSVVAPVTVIERPGVFAAFARSQELVRGNGWAVFSVIVVVYLAVLVVLLATGFAAESIGSVAGAVLQWAVTIAIAPVAALSASVLYFALRRGS